MNKMVKSLLIQIKMSNAILVSDGSSCKLVGLKSELRACGGR